MKIKNNELTNFKKMDGSLTSSEKSFSAALLEAQLTW